eukprot:1188401-Prorocentrum_minimum.AAC.1
MTKVAAERAVPILQVGGREGGGRGGLLVPVRRVAGALDGGAHDRDGRGVDRQVGEQVRLVVEGICSPLPTSDW